MLGGDTAVFTSFALGLDLTKLLGLELVVVCAGLVTAMGSGV